MVVTSGRQAAEVAEANRLDPSALDDTSESQDELDKLSESLSERMSELHKLQDSFEAAVKKQSKMIKKIQDSERAQTAQRNARRMGSRSEDNRQPVDGELEDDTQFAQRFENLKKRFHDRQQLMPSTGGTFVQLFLGSINVRFTRKSERLSFKSEYELMKLKFAPFGVIFCIICLLLPDYRWVHMIFQLFLSWYYVTLAIRENILRVNGSNIRTWWIIHHYLTMMQGVLLLTWPNGASYMQFRNPLHWFGLYNGVLMIFQTRYQMARLYALRSLGMVNEMDVASSDNTQIHWSETMTLLLPLIFLAQLMQGYMATLLFKLSRVFTNEFQIVLLCLLFSANFTGNVFTTFQVVLHKQTHIAEKSRESQASANSASSSSIASNQVNQVRTTIPEAIDSNHVKKS